MRSFIRFGSKKFFGIFWTLSKSAKIGQKSLKIKLNFTQMADDKSIGPLEWKKVNSSLTRFFPDTRWCHTIIYHCGDYRKNTGGFLASLSDEKIPKYSDFSCILRIMSSTKFLWIFSIFFPESPYQSASHGVGLVSGKNLVKARGTI